MCISPEHRPRGRSAGTDSEPRTRPVAASPSSPYPAWHPRRPPLIIDGELELDQLEGYPLRIVRLVHHDDLLLQLRRRHHLRVLLRRHHVDVHGDRPDLCGHGRRRAAHQACHLHGAAGAADAVRRSALGVRVLEVVRETRIPAAAAVLERNDGLVRLEARRVGVGVDVHGVGRAQEVARRVVLVGSTGEAVDVGDGCASGPMAVCILLCRFGPSATGEGVFRRSRW